MHWSDEFASLVVSAKNGQTLLYQDAGEKMPGEKEAASMRREGTVHGQRWEDILNTTYTVHRRFTKHYFKPAALLQDKAKGLFRRYSSRRDSPPENDGDMDSAPDPLAVTPDPLKPESGHSEANSSGADSGPSEAERSTPDAKPDTSEARLDLFEAAPNLPAAKHGSLQAEPGFFEADSDPFHQLIDQSNTKPTRDAWKAEPGQWEAEPERWETEPGQWEAEPGSLDIESDPFDQPVQQSVSFRASRQPRFRPSDVSTRTDSDEERRPRKRTNQIYVLGANPLGRYITYTLAGCEAIPPVRFLIYKRSLFEKWSKHAGISLYQGDNVDTRYRLEGQFVSRKKRNIPTMASQHGYGYIENLIVTVSSEETLSMLSLISWRINQHTTICLIGDGLGVAEFLQERLFKNPFRRPVIVLGHATHSLAYVPPDNFAVREVMQGRIYLTAYDPVPELFGMKQLNITQHPPIEFQERKMQFVQLLSAIPDLCAGGHRPDALFREKFPVTAFRAVADPLTAIMDCSYDKLRDNSFGRQLFGKGLGEICNVVARLPMVKLSDMLTAFTRDQLWKKTMHMLVRMQGLQASSKLRRAVSIGSDSDIEFLTGYFIRTGRMVGVPTPTLDSIMLMYKACRSGRQTEFTGEISFEQTDHEFK